MSSESDRIDELNKKIDLLFTSLQRLIDHQHNYILKTIKELDDKIIEIREKNPQNAAEIEDIVKNARNDVIKEMRETTVFNDVKPGAGTPAGADKMNIMVEMMKETVRVLKEQNQLLRRTK